MKTLEERIKEIELISKRNEHTKKEIQDETHNHIAYDMGRADGKVMMAEKALSIINELKDNLYFAEAALENVRFMCRNPEDIYDLLKMQLESADAIAKNALKNIFKQ